VGFSSQTAKRGTGQNFNFRDWNWEFLGADCGRAVKGQSETGFHGDGGMCDLTE